MTPTKDALARAARTTICALALAACSTPAAQDSGASDVSTNDVVSDAPTVDAAITDAVTQDVAADAAVDAVTPDVLVADAAIDSAGAVCIAAAPTNGSVSAPSATAGNTVIYTCNAGFTLIGAATATCLADGTFGTPAPMCSSSSCGTFTDVVYRTVGTFAVGGTPFGAGNQTFADLRSNASTPAFNGAGDSTPFSRPPPAGATAITNGFVRLRFHNDAAGNPVAGSARLVEWYFPLEFHQTAGATMDVNVDHSVGMLAPGLANCGGGDSACSGHAPTMNRRCVSNAEGTVTGTTLNWGACTPVPTMMTSWSFARARGAAGAGCATGYNAWGNVTCTASCAFVPASGLGDSFQTWNQALQPFTFSGADYRTATFTMPAMQIPNGTNSSVTTLSITSSTVLTTQCGSTPGTDLLCNNG